MSDSEWAKAAVLDTSYIGSGHLNTGDVERLAAGLAARGAELWIPEVVVLEFAVHAWEDLTSQRQTHKKLRQAGLTSDQPISDLDSAQIAEKLRTTFAAIPNVTIIELTGQSAAAGLRDQILGTGPGTVKANVRTGAADSAWVRGALDRAGDDPRSIVFFSGNEPDILNAAKARGHPKSVMQIVKPAGAAVEDDMLDKFFGPAPAPAELVEPIDTITLLGIIAATLRRDYDDARAADDSHGPPPEWIEIGDIRIGSHLGWGEDDEIEAMMEPEAEVEPGAELVDVAVTDVYAANQDGTGAMVDYTVRLLADVRVEGQKINNDGEGYWDWVVLRDRLLTVPYSAEICNGVLVDVTQTDTAENDTASPRFDDTFDAYKWLYSQELSGWEHIVVHPLDADSDLPKTFELRGPHGRVETVELNPPADITEDWTMEFDTTGASITATYDPSARAALGRHDSFDVFPPVSLHSTTRLALGAWSQPYTALGKVWAHLMGSSEAG